MKYFIKLKDRSPERITAYKPFLVPKEFYENVLEDAKNMNIAYVVNREKDSRVITIIEDLEEE